MTTASLNLDKSLNLPQLIEICINSFGDDLFAGERSFPSALFHVHEWLTTSTELMSHLVSLFQEWKDDHSDRCIQIFRAINYWIHSCPTHFDTHLCRMINCLRSVALEANFEDADHLLDISSLPSYSWLRSFSVRNSINGRISLSFEQWSAADISISLSHIDYKALFRIPISELKRYCSDGNLQRTPVMERSISIFNCLSNWVQYMILNKTTPADRAEMITKFVNVGKHLRKLNNFNTLMAVIGGVTHSNVARLAKTSSALSAEIKKELNKLTQLLSAHSNFSNYRKALKETTTTFRIPIMGVHLKDLICMQIKDRDPENSQMISCRKLMSLAEHLSYFICFNRTPHNFPDANMDLIHTLKVSLDIRYNEEEIYLLSLKREPRTLLSFQTTSKSVVFADWASGVSSALDQETINKHVHAMVEAVFKHYDHNKDGLISQNEFHKIAGNFPFIAPFGTIDVDKDGHITKAEMKAYFIMVNKQSMEFRREFKHNFHETTFLKPTMCAHCSKLLWGFIRQGFKCRDCGLAVHRCCKDSAVAECRRPSSSGLDRIVPDPLRSSRRLFPSLRRVSRMRTVSTVSERHTLPDDVDSCSASSACRLLLKLRPHVRKSRSRSDNIDYHRSLDAPELVSSVDLLPSLACEEVFDDDSIGIPLIELDNSAD